MNTQQSRSCNGKKRHSNPSTARIALRKTIEVTADAGLIFYRCIHCKGYHIGHAARAEQKQLKLKRLWNLIDRANCN